MLTRFNIERMPLEDVIESDGEKYTWGIEDEKAGIYAVTRKSDGNVWRWRCRGKLQEPGKLFRALHAERFPPDDGSREWLEIVARDACKMFYIIDADETEQSLKGV